MPLPKNTPCLLFSAPGLISKCAEDKLGFAVQSQTEAWHKVRLMQNIFMIKYILIQKC